MYTKLFKKVLTIYIKSNIFNEQATKWLQNILKKEFVKK